MSGVFEVGDSDFHERVESHDGFSLVDFWAPWCGPCVAFAPQLEKIAEQYKDKLVVYKLNVQDNQDVPIKYGISAVPTVLLIKKNKVISRVVGANVKQLLTAIETALKGDAD
ncbi:MAG: thioredoxin [Aaplasma endosymbiont of Hyalomma asiaticum]